MKQILILFTFMLSYVLSMGNAPQRTLIPLPNAGFEHWHTVNSTNRADHWDYVDKRENIKPHSGEYAGLSDSFKSNDIGLAPGTYVFSIYAAEYNSVGSSMTLSITDWLHNKIIAEKTFALDNNWRQYSLTFTLYEYTAVELAGTMNSSFFDIYMIFDDFSLETEDGSLLDSYHEIEIKPENSLFSYYLYQDGTAEMVRCLDKGISDEITIPENIRHEYTNYRVTTILESAFQNCSNIREINLPKQLKEIKSCAFKGCSSLQSIAFPPDLSFIGSSAFEECDALAEAEFFTKDIHQLEMGNDAFPPTTTFYVPDVSYFIPNEHLKSLGYVSDDFTYCGTIPKITVSSPQNVTLSSIDKSSLRATAGIYNLPATFSHKNGFSVNGYVTFEIKKANLRILANNKTKQYGSQNPTFDAYYEGFVNNENQSNLATKPTFNTTASYKTDVGDYVIEVGNAKSDNYDISYVNGTLTITQAPLAAKIGYYSRKYGERNPHFKIDYSGFLNGDDVSSIDVSPTIDTDANINAPVGIYELILKGGHAKNYYFSNYQKGEIQILPVPLSIIANPISRPYYSDAEYTFKCDGFVLGENIDDLEQAPEIVCEATLNSAVGNYPIYVKNAKADNYEISYQPSELTIYKRSLSVIAQDATKRYGEENPQLNYSIVGFVNGEDASALLQRPLIYTTADRYSDVGDYEICVLPGEAKNYDFSCTNAVLHIEKQNQFITWDQDLTNLCVGDIVILEASSSAGLYVNYEILNGDSAILLTDNGTNLLKCISAGDAVIRAEQPGNNNYNSAEQIFRKISVRASTSIQDVIVDTDRFDVYDLNGNCILRQETINEIRKLASGIYIILGNGHRYKIAI